ncbi:hypothetical protein [Paenibacillus sp. 1P03SA]|uniref:hypothetical protein n=1 Tax=Paenibacillus sp. 1P03SA TaxID=3132294 RepID=UPI0039A3CB60
MLQYRGYSHCEEWRDEEIIFWTADTRQDVVKWPPEEFQKAVAAAEAERNYESMCQSVIARMNLPDNTNDQPFIVALMSYEKYERKTCSQVLYYAGKSMRDFREDVMAQTDHDSSQF